MSVEAALDFLRAARAESGLRDGLAALSADQAALIEYARAAGFAFDGDELARAFAMDWAARWLHSLRKPAS